MFTHVVTRRTLNWKGRLLLSVLLLVALAAFLLNARDLLVVDAPVEADVLVVEGWLNDYAMEAAVDHYRQGKYELVVVSGNVFLRNKPLRKIRSEAERGKRVLARLGIPEDKLVAVSAPEVYRDRTYTSAKAVHEWLDDNGHSERAVNLVSFDNHSRRSWLLHQTAAQGRRQVGVFAVPSRAYRNSRWWSSSEGFRTTMGELFAYIYYRGRVLLGVGFQQPSASEGL